jgi:hypothetical protein
MWPVSFQKKSSLFGVSCANPWWVCLPISWANGDQRCNVASCNVVFVFLSHHTTFQVEILNLEFSLTKSSRMGRILTNNKL